MRIMANTVSRKDNEKQKQESQTQTQPEVLEYGDIYFFYRPKVGSPEVKNTGDVRRFFMVTAPEETTTKSDRELEIWSL